MTEQTTLIDRYIYAATRSVPESGRADLRAELEASIRDAIDARVESGEELDTAERTVLTDLGDPDKLAADYTDRPSYLIGPRYYFEWRRLVRTLVAIVLPIAVFGVTVGQALSGRGIGEVIGSAIGSGVTIALHLVFWPTLIFAILERNTRPSPLETSRATADGPWAPWTIDRLPQLRDRGAGLSDMVGSLVFIGLVAAAIVWDRLIGFVPRDGGPLPVLDPALWPWWIAGLFLLLAAEAGLAVLIYRRGRYTPALAAVNTLIALAVAVPALLLLQNGMLINPDFLTEVYPNETVIRVMATITGFGIAVVALWDIADGWVKATRTR